MAFFLLSYLHFNPLLLDSQVSPFSIPLVGFTRFVIDFVNEMVFMAASCSSSKYHLGSKQIVVTEFNVTNFIIPIRKIYSTLLF